MPGHAREERLDLARVAYGEVVVLARKDVTASAEDSRDLVCRVVDPVRRYRARHDAADPVVADHPVEKVENGMNATSSWSVPNVAPSPPARRRRGTRCREAACPFRSDPRH